MSAAYVPPAADEIRRRLEDRWMVCYLMHDDNPTHATLGVISNRPRLSDEAKVIAKKLEEEGVSVDEDQAFNYALAADIERSCQDIMKSLHWTRERLEYELAFAAADNGWS